MKTEILNIMRDPSNSDFYIASYTGDGDNEAHNLAYKGGLSDAINAALNVWGLEEDEVHIEASN